LRIDAVVDVWEVIVRYVDPEELTEWLPPTLHVVDEQVVSVDVRDDVLVVVAEHLDGVVLVVEPTPQPLSQVISVDSRWLIPSHASLPCNALTCLRARPRTPPAESDAPESRVRGGQTLSDTW
jgi:hypothetical protein